jgi:DNA-binding XRE family transcriptional regulator
MTIFVPTTFHYPNMDKDINRIKVVLAEKKRTNKWLAEQLGCAPTTVSKWCTNACQPPMETYIKIAKLLEVELSELVNSKFGDTI